MKKNYFFLFLFCLYSIVSWAQTEPFCTTVYDMNYDGSKYYRIPALTQTEDGTLVAIADKRGNELGDLPNDISVVCRRSSNNGETWSDPIVIAKGNGKGQGYGDPLVIFDRNTKKLICIFAGKQGLWDSTHANPITINISESTDNGLNWSEPRDITNQIYQSNWYGSFAGSGNGLQLKDGRLIFVVATRLTAQRGGTLTNYAVYSDDHGQTWKASAPVLGKGDEAKVVELENGEILMSIRNPDKGNRKFAISKNRGETWETPTYNNDLKDPACNGDIIRYSHNGVNCLLQSLPNSSSTREKVTIYASFDEGKTWKASKEICNSYSAYSSMTVLPDGEIGILVEEGKWDKNLPGEDGFVLKFLRINPDWLTESGEDNNGNEMEPTGTLVLDAKESRYMRIPNSKDFYPTAGGEYTVTCKVKLANFIANSNMRFISCRGYEGTSNSATSGYEFFGGNNSSNSFSVNLSLNGKPWGAGHAWSTVAMKENEWVHLTWTFNGAEKTSKIYVNGQLAGTKNIPEYANNSWENGLDMLIGAGYSNNNGSECTATFFTTGEIDDVRFFNKAFTEEEINADINNTINAQTPNLVAAYDFADIQGTIVKDISGHGHDGTLVNFPTIVQKYTVNITAPDTNEGTLRVMNGETEVTNGSKIAAGTVLTVDAAPAANHALDSIFINGTAITGNTFTLDKDVTVSATFSKKSGELEYAIPDKEHNDRTGQHRHSRLMKTITINGATMNGEAQSFTYTLNNENGQDEVYQDATSYTLNVTSGDTINVSWDFRNAPTEWMHYYLYIDYNKNGVFDVNDGELVSYSYKNNQDSQGNPADPGKACYKLPEFQIPADAVAQSTRMRLKCDWDSTDPTGNPASDNIIGVNGGTIVDFTIVINGSKVTPTYTVTVEEPENGTVKVTDMAGNDITGEVEEGTELQVTATPNEGYNLESILVNGVAIEGNKFTVKEATTVTATFKRQEITVTYSITEGSKMTVLANDTEVASGSNVAKGSELTVKFEIEKGKVLNEVLVNDKNMTASVKDNMLTIADCQENIVIKATTTIAEGINQTKQTKAYFDAANATLVLPVQATAVIFDITGSEVAKINQTATVAFLKNGCYIARVVTASDVQTIKFIKK